MQLVKRFWQDDSGDGYIAPLLSVIFAMATAAVVFTALFIGLKNLAIKQAQGIQNVNP